MREIRLYGTPVGFYTDHLNRDRLDNRKQNLKNVSWQENRINLSIHKDNLTGQKNIDFIKKFKKWRVRVQRFKKIVFENYYPSLNQAIVARNNFYGGKSTV